MGWMSRFVLKIAQQAFLVAEPIQNSEPEFRQ